MANLAGIRSLEAPPQALVGRSAERSRNVGDSAPSSLLPVDVSVSSSQAPLCTKSVITRKASNVKVFGIAEVRKSRNQ